LLINKAKFDLRLYVLITNINPLTAFICKEGMARLCTAEYKEPKKSNLKNKSIHFTNFNDKKEDIFIVEEE